jgi:hypothetical protein
MENTGYILIKILRFGHREKNPPPGPPTIPILGNAHLIPTKNFHLKYVPAAVSRIGTLDTDMSHLDLSNGTINTASYSPSKWENQP